MFRALLNARSNKRSRTSKRAAGAMRFDRSRSLQVESLEQRAMLNAKWTVLVYMDDQNSDIYGGDSLDSAAVYNVGQMESVGSTASVNIVTELGRPVDSGSWTDTRRALIVHNTNPNVMLSFTGSNYTDLGNNVNMTTTGALQSFIQWGVATYPADHYMLDLWDHGGGLDGVCFNDYGSSLSFSNVTQALSGAGTHMDLVAFDACLVGMEEMAHQLTGLADVMVASEESVPGNGFLARSSAEGKTTPLRTTLLRAEPIRRRSRSEHARGCPTWRKAFCSNE